MKVFIVFFETGSYDDHSYTLQGVFTTRSLAELYIKREKEKNTYLSSLTNEYTEALRKWREENRHQYVEPPEPQLYDLIRSMRGELCDDCKKSKLSNEICQQCLSKEDRKKAVNKHSMNKSVWRQQCQQISKEYSSAQRVFERSFIKPYEEKLRVFGVDNSDWHRYLYCEDDKFEIEEHEVICDV